MDQRAQRLTATPLSLLLSILALPVYPGACALTRVFLPVRGGPQVVSLGDKRIWGDAAAQPPISVECEATDSDHSVVTFNVARGAGTRRYWS